MTTTATPLDPRQAPNDQHATSLTFPRVVRAEFIKLRTLRSTVWCFALIVLLALGSGLLLAVTFDRPEVGSFDVDTQKNFIVLVGTIGVNLTQLVAAVLGVLIISGEYTTGMIRSTFAAVPTRLPALFAKALVLAVSMFVVGLGSIIATVLVTMPILLSKGIDVNLLDGDVMLALLGGAGYLTLIAVLAFTFGAILRNSAGGISSVLGLLLVVPTMLTILLRITGAAWVQNVMALLPSEAGSNMFAIDMASSTADTLPPAGWITLDSTQGFLVLLAWVAVLLVTAAVLVKRRDA